MERLKRNPTVLLLGGAIAVAAVLTLVLASRMTFFADTWELLMNRRELTLDTLMQPHNEHWVLFPTLFEKLFLQLFGMTSATPEYVLLIVFLCTTAALLYVYVKRRVGPWLGLFAAVALLFLGPAWEVLLWPFEITFCGPIMFGLAMLLALEREDRLGDALACLFLTVALGFSSLALPFIVAAAVVIGLGPRETWARRAYVVIVPVLVFAAWYVGWGHDAESHLGLRNVLASPRYVFEAVAVALGALVGLGTSPETGISDPVWGRALLVALVIGIVCWKIRRPGFDRGLWPVAAAAATNWFLTAFNAFPGREPTASRYQYAGVIFIVLILANLFKGVRLNRTGILVGAALTALAVAPNLVVLDHGADTLKREAILTKADTAALGIASRTVDPEFQLSPEVAGTGTLVNVYAGLYEQADAEYGSPAYSVAELNAAPEEGRRQADVVLAQALPLTRETTSGTYAAGAGGGCETVAPGGDEVALEPGTTTIELPPGPPAELSLRRFAVGEYPVAGREVEGDSVTKLTIPADKAHQPWYLKVEASAPARVCR